MRRIDILSAVFVVVMIGGCNQSEKLSETKAGEPGHVAKAAAPAEPNGPSAGRTAEEQLADQLARFSATALDGSTYTVSDQKGKVVLLNAWATWCGPCRYEIPELKRLHQKYGSEGLEIVGVSVDVAQAEPAVRQFVEVNRIDYPILLDPQSRLTMTLRTTSIPTSVIIDRQGRIVWRHVGIVSEQRDESFRKALSAALAS